MNAGKEWARIKKSKRQVFTYGTGLPSGWVATRSDELFKSTRRKTRVFTKSKNRNRTCYILELNAYAGLNRPDKKTVPGTFTKLSQFVL